MPWYEDDEVWSGFAEVIFAAERVVQAADAVARSPLLRFGDGARVLDQCCGPACTPSRSPGSGAHTSFGYFEDPDENLRVLRNAHESLAPGGVLVMDLLGKEVHARTAGATHALPVEDGVVYVSDTVAGLHAVQHRVDTRARRHGPPCLAQPVGLQRRRTARPVPRRGVRRRRVFGDFDGGPYDDTAERLVVRGVRAG